MKSDNGSVVSAQSSKHRQARIHEVSSRYLSSSPSSTTTSLESGFISPRHGLFPNKRRAGSNSTGTGKHQSLEDPGFIRDQLWPSSSRAAASVERNLGTLANHIRIDRIRECLDRKLDEKFSKPSSSFSQSERSRCREFTSSENDKNNSSKENDRPIIGGYAGKFGSPRESSSSSTKKPNSNDSDIVSRRLSLEENALYKKSLSSRRSSVSFTNPLDSESDYIDVCLSVDFSSPPSGRAFSSRKLGKEVPSKYMNDVMTRRTSRGDSDSNLPNPLSYDNPPLSKKFTLKKAIKKANSLSGYQGSKSQWALSPGRSGSPALSVESKDKTMSFSSLKHPTSPSKVKGVEKFLTMGFDLFKTKKSTLNSPPMGFGNSEAAHQLRLLDNRLMQWRYVNARSEAVNGYISHQAKSNVIYAWDGLTKLQHSVLQKKVQFGREKSEMKLNYILFSQMKLLEAWGGMERLHLSAITVMKECLHSVVCKVPLLEGAKVDIQSASVALLHASDLTASMKSRLTSISPSADKTAALLSELAKVVAQENQLLEEFYDLLQTIFLLQLQERSVNCSLIQLECWQPKYQLQQLPPETTS